jgi:hypothetical protein
MSTDQGDGSEMLIPYSQQPIDIGGGGIVGPTVVPRQRQVKLIRPRKWKRVEASRVQDIWYLECPYCLSLVADESAADEHLWRLHANNTRSQPGGFDLIPWLTELQRQVDHMEEDMLEPDTWGSGVDRRQTHEWRDRKRRRVHWRTRGR